VQDETHLCPTAIGAHRCNRCRFGDYLDFYVMGISEVAGRCGDAELSERVRWNAEYRAMLSECAVAEL
jgi:hypothetical protein